MQRFFFPPLLQTFLLLVPLIHSSVSALAQQPADYKASPWLQAVGRLTVPSKQWLEGDWHHSMAQCSATLLRTRTTDKSRYILSAWHCLEYYRDLSQNILFLLPTAEEPRIAHLISSGGSMEADWALLKLDIAIDNSQALPLSARDMPIQLKQVVKLAGYSKQASHALQSAPLSYDDHCIVTSISKALISTNCRARKGASGGPVTIEIDGEHKLLGVVSKGDSADTSLYVPVSVFAAALRRAPQIAQIRNWHNSFQINTQTPVADGQR